MMVRVQGFEQSGSALFWLFVVVVSDVGEGE